jgi:hypothetical protein
VGKKGRGNGKEVQEGWERALQVTNGLWGNNLENRLMLSLLIF